MSNEFDDAEVLTPAKEILHKFGGSPKPELEAMVEKPEEMAAELLEIRERMKKDEEQEKKILDYFKAKKDRGMYNLGGVLLEIKEEKGRKTVDWKQYILDAEGADGVKAVEEKYSRVGAPIIKVSVKKFQT